jgi:hypothetical protein
MSQPAARTFTKSIRNKVAGTSEGLPLLGDWLRRVEALGDPDLTEAVEGIWCGRDGEERIDMPGTKSLLVVGWHNGRVEFSYLS